MTTIICPSAPPGARPLPRPGQAVAKPLNYAAGLPTPPTKLTGLTARFFRLGAQRKNAVRRVAYRRLVLLVAVVLSLPTLLPAQGNQVSGVVVDESMAEPLVFATVFCAQTNSGVYTNEEGLFVITAPEGTAGVSLLISHIGYRDTTIVVRPGATGGQPLRIGLRRAADLPLVDVRAARKTRGNSSSFFSPDVEKLKAMPMLFGEVDVLKSLTLLPGISTGLEGTSNIQIRGGNPSQTHLLLDGISLYNTGHFGGFLSSVDPYGVKAVNVYKGGIPARFGGRLSGVLEVDVRDGRKDQTTQELAVGTATLRYGREGQLGQHGKYLAAGRFSFPSLLVNAFNLGSFRRGEEGNKTVASMYDGLLKTRWALGPGTLSTFLFTTGDFGLIQEVSGNTLFLDQYRWNTNAFAVGYDLLLGNRLALATRAYASRYAYYYRAFEEAGRQSDDPTSRELEQSTRLNDLNASVDLDWFVTDLLKVSAGVDLKRHDFSSTAFQRLAAGPDRALLNDRSGGLEYGLYAQLDLSQYANKLTGSAGLRLSGLTALGGSVNLEPRLRLAYEALPRLFLNLGYDRNAQYLHQLVTNNAIFPNDVWILADRQFAPATSQQLYAGVAFGALGGSTTVSVEAFSKRMDELITLRDFSVDLFALPADWRGTVATGGRGRVSGLEVSVQKTAGRLSGWVAYTLSRSERRSEQINGGNWFPFTYDRTHDGAVTLSYELTNGWSCSANFLYQTGAAVTFPVAATAEYFIFGDINNARLPDYHRLDLALARTFRGNKRKHVWHTISLGLFNAYNRSNPVDFRLEPTSQVATQPGSGQTVLVNGFTARQRAIFPVVPSVSYQRKIGER